MFSFMAGVRFFSDDLCATHTEPLTKHLNRILILNLLIKAVDEMIDAAKAGDNAKIAAYLTIYSWFQKMDAEAAK